MRYSIAERIGMIQCYFECKHYTKAIHKFVYKFPNSAAPTRRTISNLVSKWQKYGTVADKVKSGRPKSATNEDIQTNVLAAVHINPRASAVQLAQDHGISKSAVRRIKKIHSTSTDNNSNRPKSKVQQQNEQKKKKKINRATVKPKKHAEEIGKS